MSIHKRKYSLLLLIVLCAIGFGILGTKLLPYFKENRQYFTHVFQEYQHRFHFGKLEGYAYPKSWYAGEVCEVFLYKRPKEKQSLALYNSQGSKVLDLDPKYIDLEPLKPTHTHPWQPSAKFSFNIPEVASGLYLINNQIPLLIGKRKAKITVLYPSFTIQAYNVVGGKSFYSLFTKKTAEISLVRPVFPARPFMAWEGLKYFQLQFPEAGYITDLEMSQMGVPDSTEILVIIGHSEYWTRNGRRNFDDFITKGGNALVLSGNTMWWQTRIAEDSNSIICNKEIIQDGTPNSLQTIRWRDPLLDYPISPSIGLTFTAGGFGKKGDDPEMKYLITDDTSPLFVGTNLKNGDSFSLPAKEVDGVMEEFFSESLDSFPILEKWADYPLPNGKSGAIVRYQKSATSGTILNMGNTDWCSPNGLGGKDKKLIEKMTKNAIDYLMEKPSE